MPTKLGFDVGKVNDALAALDDIICAVRAGVVEPVAASVKPQSVPTLFDDDLWRFGG